MKFYHGFNIVYFMYIKYFPLITLCLFFSLSTSAQPVRVEPFSATYEIRINNIKVAELSRELTVSEKGLMNYKTLAKTTGIVALLKKDTTQEVSQFTIIDSRLRPLSYRYQRDRKKKSKTISLEFDHAAKKILSTVNESQYQVAFNGRTYDKLSSQLVMMLQRQSDQSIQRQFITDGKKISAYDFRKLADEIMSVGHEKNLHVEKWERIKESSEDKTVFWLAENLNFLPVKVEIYEQGEDMVSITLSDSSLLNKAD